MAERPVCLLILLMPSPRLELRTLASYITMESGILFESAKKNCTFGILCFMLRLEFYDESSHINQIYVFFMNANSLNFFSFCVNIMLFDITKYLLSF
jgi:hypothetical protein